ncbi:MAG: cation diffusion facilitator family transporter [Halobacteriaceae archaeon]
MAGDRVTFLRAAWVNVVGNVLKIVVEGGVGLALGSLALVADAAHSLADLLSSGVVLVWGRLAFAAPDEGHPHGHERVEPVTALFVGATLVVLAAKFLWDAGATLLRGPDISYSWPLLAALGVAILDMLVVYWYTERANADLQMPALRALAADCLNDVYTSLAALAGVVGVALGYPALDAVAGGLVSLLVGYHGVAIARENLSYLVGSAPPPRVREAVAAAIRDHPAVRGVHDLRVYYIGTEVEVEFHAEVDGDYTLREAHDLESDLVSRVRAVGDDVGDVHVHLDPAGLGEWKDAPHGTKR